MSFRERPRRHTYHQAALPGTTGSADQNATGHSGQGCERRVRAEMFACA